MSKNNKKFKIIKNIDNNNYIFEKSKLQNKANLKNGKKENQIF